MLRVFYTCVVVLCFMPIIPGILGVISTALAYLPALNMTQISSIGLREMLAWNGISHAIGLTLFTTLASSAIACLVSFAVLQGCWHHRYWQKIERTLAPLLALPHVAFAIGFAFLFSSTGLIARLSHSFSIADISQTSDTLPLLIKDPFGIGLLMMLVMKEVPFLLLMSIPILQQLNLPQTEKVCASLGYTPTQTWWKCVLPQWLRQMRFPLFAVIAYSVSVVDVALILGPTHPPTFAVLVWQWFNDPDLSQLPRAATGAFVLLLLALGCMGVARLIEALCLQQQRDWQSSGRYAILLPGKTLFALILIISAAVIPILLIWSVALRWRFPTLLPSQTTLRFWLETWPQISDTLITSVTIALISATAALCLALVTHEYHTRYRVMVPNWMIALPMLIPQLSILFGLQIMTLSLNSHAYFFWVCWAHLFFAYPYVYLALDGPWRSFNQNYMHVALSLGKSYGYAWWRIKLPQLRSAVLFAWAVGISVSLAQYLPTLILGAGRITTLTTEAVALSSGFDRRITAIYALCQALLPLIFFALTIIISQQVYRRRTTLATYAKKEAS
ncbi:thiamine ABC transporter permease [Vibrio sp. SM6]|uniref:Thiamine ABC transporter permease n=2 Tax=Vibrio agarilyticus TaxID=2726741 RepID=A0A7X8TMP5_9VIBR|nr:thiamine ABC transporter permease [Vibrio agarilyticus]NLS11400.1 thiamine ABC transporter permease [Vibrio agarilyticus]